MHPKLFTNLPFFSSYLTTLGSHQHQFTFSTTGQPVKLTHRVYFFLAATAHDSQSLPLSLISKLSSFSLASSYLALHSYHRHVFLYVPSSFCTVLQPLRIETRGCVHLLNPPALQGTGDWAAYCECFLLKCFMFLLLLLFSFRYRVKTVSSCLLLPGQSQKLSVIPFIHSVY